MFYNFIFFLLNVNYYCLLTILNIYDIYKIFNKDLLK